MCSPLERTSTRSLSSPKSVVRSHSAPSLRVGVPLLLEQRQRVRDRARVALVQRALVRPVVEVLARRKPRSDACICPTIIATAARPSSAGSVDARGSAQARDELGHVVALVAVLGHRLAARQRLHRLAELAHLRAGVVDVELALDVVAVEREHARERVAVGGVAGVADVHRPGRVGGDELDQDALAARAPPPAPNASPAASTSRERAVQPGRQEQVQKARPGDLEALEAARRAAAAARSPEPLGDLARRAAEAGRQQQRGVGRVVAELRARRTLERDLPATGLSCADRAPAGRSAGELERCRAAPPRAGRRATSEHRSTGVRRSVWSIVWSEARSSVPCAAIAILAT